MLKCKKITFCLCVYLMFLISACNSFGLKKSYEHCKEKIPSFPGLIFSLSSKLAREIPLDEGFIMSPLSITAALTMIYVGADGKTKEEMNKVLNFDKIGYDKLKTISKPSPVNPEDSTALLEKTKDTLSISDSTTSQSDSTFSEESQTEVTPTLSPLNSPDKILYGNNESEATEKTENHQTVSGDNKTELFMVDVIVPDTAIQEFHDELINTTENEESESKLTKRDLSSLNIKKRNDNQMMDIHVMKQFRDLILALELDSQIKSILVANSVFVQKGFQVSTEYVNRIQNYLQSEIHYEDFANEKIATMENINEWVSKKTNSEIKKLINEPLDQMTMMVLANVVFFKGLWKYPFREAWTSYFKKVDGTRVSVTFMKAYEFFNYYYDEDINYSFLELDYNSGNMSMILILPSNRTELPSYYLDQESLCYIRSKFQLRNVAVGIPKLHHNYSRELSKDMTKLGLKSLFSEKADLSGIREENDINVSLMLHKAVIEIDEKGSKASAITGVGIDSRKRPSYDAIFWANHPFVYYIIEKTTNTVLFFGRVTHL